MKQLRSGRHKILERVGRRGIVLAILGAMNVLYGSALFFSTKESGYWPAFLGSIYGIPVHVLGIMWFVAGLFLWTGVVLKHDAIQFAVAVFVKAGWAIVACGFFLSVRNGHGTWGVAAIYIGFASVVLVIAGWPEDEH